MRDVIYSFKTANLSVMAYAEPEDTDPADLFDFQEDIDAINNGDVEYFQVTVEITHNHTGGELGSDYLGGCSYNSTDEFVDSHRDRNPMNRNCSVYRAKHPNSVICHYFPSMIRQACDEARDNLRKLRNLPVRENA